MALSRSPSGSEPPLALRRPRRRGRTIALVALGMLLSIAGAAAYVYYSVLPAAIAPRLVAVLEARLGPGHRVTVGETRLITSSGRIELQAAELGITDPEGREVAFAPDARVELDSAALMRGEVAIASLHLDHPRLVLRSPVEGETAPPQAPVSAVNRDLLAHLVGTLDRLTAPGGAAAALEEVRVSSAALVLDRADAEDTTRLDRLSVQLRRGDANGFAITVSSEGSVDRWSATLTSTAPSAEGRVFDLGLDSVSLATVARLGGLDPAPDYDATVSGHMSIRLDRNAVFQAGEARLDLGALTFLLPGPGKTKLAFDRVQLRGRWDGEARSIKLDPSPVVGGGGGVTLVGEALAPAVGSADPWQIRLQGLQAEVPGEPGDPPLRLDALTARAAFHPDKSMLELLEGHIVGPTVNVALSGSVTFGDSSPAIALGVATAPMTVSAMKRLWPFFLAAPVREWVLANVLSGSVSGFSMMADIKQGVLAAQKPFEPLPDQAIYIESSFSDTAIIPGPGLPPLLGATGRLRASGRHVEMLVDSARIEPAPGQAIAVRGKFEVPNTEPRFPQARVELQVEGQLAGAAQLFATGALGPSPLPPAIDPAAVRGAFTAQSLIGLTLGPAGEVPPIEVKVDGQMKDVAIEKLVAGKALEAGTFRVVRDPGGVVTVVGDAKIGGATTQIDLRDEGAGGRREVLASATLDASARNYLGMPGGKAIRGPIPVKIRAPLVAGPIEVQAELGAAELDGLVPGLAKRPGVPGKMSFTMLKTPEAITLRDIAIDSGVASIRGDVDLDAAGGLVAAKLGTFRLSAGDDVRISVERSKGLTRVALNGNAIDLRPLMADLFAGDTGEATAPDLDLDVVVDTAIGHNGERALGLKLSLSRRAGMLKTLEVKSDRFGSGRVEVRPLAGGAGYLFTGDDAGSFLRFLDVYSKAFGGKFNLRISSSARFDGQLEVEGFEIRGERALASVTSNDRAWTDERTGVRETQRAGPHTVTFTKLKMRFSRNGGRLSLDDVVVWGPQIGLSLEGVLDVSANRVNVTGTFVPAYSLNNLFSKVPVIGFFLGGGNEQGLLGVTFRVSGTLSNPTLSINPMSAVAPGFLRKIFEFRQSEGTATADTTGRSSVAPRSAQ